jgi:membrane-associated protease RseP (regulator of RpoE activity)
MKFINAMKTQIVATVALALCANVAFCASQDSVVLAALTKVTPKIADDGEAESSAGGKVSILVPTDSKAGNQQNETDTWLGVSAVEASDALTSQLTLPPGVGLVISFVASNSPAAKAGLQKNDVLTRFEDQSLVHPAQLRKLVQVRKDGDKVKLAFYRAGKEQSITVTLGKTEHHSTWGDAGRVFDTKVADFKHLFNDDGGLKDQLNIELKDLRDSFGNFKIDGEVRESIRRGMDEARKALRDALQNTTNLDAALGPLKQTLQELERSKVVVDDKASVTVRSAGEGVKSLVKADESGTIVLLNLPKLHLTAHDKDGKLLFDGEIETKAQRDAVPPDLWERVEPLLGKLQATELEEREK